MEPITEDIRKHIESLLGQLEDEYYRGIKISKFYNYKKQMNEGIITEQMIDDIVGQLKSDIISSRKNEPVSECAFFAPRRNSSKQNIADIIRMNIFPPKDDSKDAKIKSCTTYQKCLSTLTSQFKEQEFVKLVFKHQFKISRLSEHRELWEKLKKRPVSEQIMNPKAMPVEIATGETLEPFFNYLSSRSAVDPDSILWIPSEQCMKFTRGAIYTDGRMDLCKQVVGPTHIGKLIDSIRFNPHIKHFLLGNNIMGTTGCIAIKDFLLNEHTPLIHTWYLAGNDINEEGIKHLVDGLISDPDVRELWLKRNPIRSQGMKEIQRLLENNQNLITLDLHNTAVFDEGMEYICTGLKKNTGVRKLYLDANAIGPKGCDYLIDYFKHIIDTKRIGITSLWLEMNRIDDDAMIKLITVLGNYEYLERLCIGSNMLSGISMEAIYHSFKDHKNLIVLDLGMYKSTADMGEITNRIGLTGSMWIGKFIAENKSIEYLSILHNDIPEEGINNIAEALTVNDTIVSLDFKQYFTGIHKDIHQKIMDKLKFNYQLKGISEAEIGTYVRELKHTPDIVNIDSIYRNNDKATGPVCVMKHH